ncbi:MAG: glycoside hydrolase family 99-like domain-containing protein [Cytophagales bacterium]
MSNNDIKIIAINLPQFHPFAENDEWWGKGFTEWTNVTKSLPRFKGHYQPQLPTDLGFYDLRLEESRIAQAELAKAHGIDGFCYYHYWFNGKRLMNRPLDDMLKTQTPDFPFMFCWANENWTRRWDGQEQEVLIKQDYSFEDDREHIRFLIKTFFADPRYIKVNGKPFFCVYRPNLFPDIAKTIAIWKEEAKIAGLPGLYLGYFQSFGVKTEYCEKGFDTSVQFPPQSFEYTPLRVNNETGKLSFCSENYNTNLPKDGENIVFDYSELVYNSSQNSEASEKQILGVTPSWDNSARRKNNPFVLVNSTPDLFGKWLNNMLFKTVNSNTEHKFLFINAMNEWAEGNHLEPCIKWGKAYLEIIQSIKSKNLIEFDKELLVDFSKVSNVGYFIKYLEKNRSLVKINEVLKKYEIERDLKVKFYLCYFYFIFHPFRKTYFLFLALLNKFK